MIKIFISIIIFGLFFETVVAEGADWKNIDISDNEIIFYIDVDSIKHTSNNLVRGWIKQEYRQPNKNISYALHYKEFDCKEKKVRFLSTILHYKDGSSPFSTDKKGNWIFIPPDSALEVELNLLCNKKENP
jgi:hypothetical protein